MKILRGDKCQMSPVTPCQHLLTNKYVTPKHVILYTVGKIIENWTTFLLTKISENVLNESKKRNKFEKLRHHFWSNFVKIESVLNPDILYIVEKIISWWVTFLSTKMSENMLNKSKKRKVWKKFEKWRHHFW